MRKKSNQTPPDTAASSPATRSPVAAPATTQSTSTRIATASETVPRIAARTAQVAKGATAAVTLAARRQSLTGALSSTPSSIVMMSHLAFVLDASHDSPTRPRS